jgi:hypothetical protein
LAPFPREGQIHYQSHFLRIDPVLSLREDVPPDPTVEPYRPKPDDAFMSVYRPEFKDLQGAFKAIDEVQKR